MKVHCTHCGTKTPQTEKGQADETEEIDEEDEFPPYIIQWTYSLFQCDVCNNVSLQCFSPDINDDYFQIFPVIKKLGGLPVQIQTSYSEAKKVQNISPLAFSVLIGRSLEYICEDQKAVGKDLYEKLRDLSNKGIIPETLAQVSHAIRSFRNIGAHAENTPFQTAEARIIDDLFVAILEYVYITPEILRKAEEHLKKK